MAFEMLDHTGDLAVRLRAPDLPGLIESGVQALRGLLFTGESSECAELCRGELVVRGVDREDVLVQALQESLHLMQTEALFPREIRVEVLEGPEARVWLRGVRADGRGLRPQQEIKAVTYHAVEICERDGELEAVIVLDV